MEISERVESTAILFLCTVYSKFLLCLRPIFSGRKHEIFIAAVKKWEMLAATKVKKKGREKKRTGTHVSRKFLEVLRCSRAKTAAKKCTKKCAARAKLFFD